MFCALSVLQKFLKFDDNDIDDKYEKCQLKYHTFRVPHVQIYPWVMIYMHCLSVFLSPYKARKWKCGESTK